MFHFRRQTAKRTEELTDDYEEDEYLDVDPFNLQFEFSKKELFQL